MINIDDLHEKDFEALAYAQYYSVYASHIGMWQFRDKLTEVVDAIHNGNRAPAKTKGFVFERGLDNAEFETVKVGKSEYLVRKDCLQNASTGIGTCLGINSKLLEKLINNDFAYVGRFWDKNDCDSIHHITEDGLYRGLRHQHIDDNQLS